MRSGQRGVLQIYLQRYILATGEAAFITGDSQGNIAAPDATGVNIQSGSQQMSLYGIKNVSSTNQPLYTASNNVGSLSRTTALGVGIGNLDPASEVLICLVGGTNQSGLLTIGGNTSGTASNGGLSVTLSVRSGKTC